MRRAMVHTSCDAGCLSSIGRAARCHRLLAAALAAYTLSCTESLAEESWDDSASEGAQPRYAPGYLGTLEGHKGHIYALATSPDGWLASGARDRVVAVWNLTNVATGQRTRKPSRRLTGHNAGITALAFAEGGLLLSGSADNTTRIWDISRAEALEVVHHPRTVFGVAVRPRSTAGAAAGPAVLGHAAEVGASSGGEFATACWDGVLRIFSLPAGASKGELHGHQGGLYSVAYSPLDGSLLASAGADGTIRIWNLNRMELLWSIQAHRGHATTVDWSPVEPFVLASGGWDRKFRLWSISAAQMEGCRATGRCSADLQPRAVRKHPQLIWRVAFAPQGDLVAACHGAVGQSPTVLIYDAATGKVHRRLGRHRDTPLVIAWSSDSSVIASGGMDRKVLLYDGRGDHDDLPQGDADDSEEKLTWMQDLLQYQAEKRGENITDTSKNETKNMSDGQNPKSIPHPLAGPRVPFW